MGRKLGNFLIIYGVVNFFCCLIVTATSGALIWTFGGLIWMVILILLGNWQRGKARAEEARDDQTRLLRKISKKQQFAGLDKQLLSDAINDVLNEREGKDKEALK